MLLSPVLLGQFVFSDVARDVSMLASLYMRSRKLTHLACPMVWPPGIFFYFISVSITTFCIQGTNLELTMIYESSICLFTKLVPESAIMSDALSPLFEKDLVRSVRSRVGAGMSLFAASRLAVNESRLPRLTAQVGPPSWNRNFQLLLLFVSIGIAKLECMKCT